MNSFDTTGERRTGTEKGSALLIVFVFAAMIAIMLYKEMPVAAFEAQRQKEQLLIDRGNEYSHAVKLFVRKLQIHPASMEALEKTNQIRFLRHRFKDPFTGKDDWRVLHAGPNGTLMDSKVKLAGFGQNGSGSNAAGVQNGPATGSAAFGSSSNGANPAQANGGFGNNGFGADSGSTPPEVVVAPIPQRGPAIAANGNGVAGGAGADQNPLAPLLPPGQAEANTEGQAGTGQAGASGAGNTTGMSGRNGALGGGENASAGNGNPLGPAGNPRPNVLAPQGQAGGPGTGLGTITSGGIAGVASKASGHSIKTVNEQTDYLLWEFYYDPAKDASRGIANAVGALGAGQQGNGQQPGLGQNQQQQNGVGANSSFGPTSSFEPINSFGPNTALGAGSGSPANGSNGSPGPTPFPTPGTQQPQPPQ